MRNKKIITIYLDEDVANQLEERANLQKTSVNRLLNMYLKDDILGYMPPKSIIQKHLRVLELYLEDEEEKNDTKIDSLKLCLKVIDPTINDEVTKARRAKIEQDLSDCINKAKILKAKKTSIEIIRQKLEYLSDL